MLAPDTPAATPSTAPLSAWTPLKRPLFRMLWGTLLTANVCMWMNDVAAAWLMTSLSDMPVMVALVQSASTLPILLLGLPSGALADIVDRRRLLIGTQFWVAAVGAVICIATFSGHLNAPLLLAMTFANGVGLAMRWPVVAALMPELVPRRELGMAVALNGVAMNISRIIGPVVAGALIATAGSSWVFLLNAVLSLATGALLLLTWRREPKESDMPRERFFGAIRVGLQYVRQSPRLHAVLLRVASFFFFSTALLALLPLVAKGLPEGNAGTYTLLMSSMGAGAIIAAVYLPRARHRYSIEAIARLGTLLHAAATLAVAYAPNAALAAPALLIAGMAWTSTANSLTLAAQTALPGWVKARGMAVYQMALMGGATLGSALWGQVATLSTLRTSLVSAAAAAVVALFFTALKRVPDDTGEDWSPVRSWKDPDVALPIGPHQGPVLVTIEYRIDPDRATEFRELMSASRRVRLGNGATSWELFRDAADPGRFIEHYVDESWVAHMRQHERVTAFDVVLDGQKAALHVGDAPPEIIHYIAEPVRRIKLALDPRHRE
jgi:MFS family permease